jgi:hypothetical protein
VIQKEALPDFAIEWVKRLGVNPKTLISLKGGVNAQVFRCGKRDRYFVLKGYARSVIYGQDRFLVESEFLKYTQNIAPRLTPRILFSDAESRSIVLEYVDGQVFSATTPPKEKEILEAVNFYQMLNEKNNSKKISLPAAAEGFLKITDHLDNIESRLGQMTIEHIPVQLKSIARKIISSLKYRAETLRADISSSIFSGVFEDAIDVEDRHVSPGDFGFHNAILTKQGVKFIDFEFSGLDDPSKTILDFDLQPRVPVLPKSLILLNAIPENSKLKIKNRCNTLKPILRLKWGCIILNVLNSERWHQISTYHPEQVSLEALRKRLHQGLDYSLEV